MKNKYPQYLKNAKEHLRKSLEQPLTSKELKEYDSEYERLMKKQRKKYI